ncbi:MAG: endonuclease/exonuclease/phosphatase family protein [Cyanobacteria bacterium CRU_2_1]|nr:endonuclease/exonuclease/phosphatase family protein [Cyanobacteria bacterium RU_5_0]NJR59687.1 endonuclease/exonuclease/phosphatase family protein [Cyanobacteria bacterium CRU_2_1]
MVVKVITINILFDMDVWTQRRELLVEGLAAEAADVIGVQEVNLQHETGAWLAEQLGMPYVYQVPFQQQPYNLGLAYGIAILSRYPFTQQAQLDLQSQGRFAQYVQIEIDHRSLVFCNGHYFWKPGSTPDRIKQLQHLNEWLSELPTQTPIIAVGDFNATPDTPEIALMRERFISAYATHHGQEPDYTCPTPLSKRKSLWKSIALKLLNLWVNHTLKRWRGTLDYIFISPSFMVRDCRLILTEPAPNNKQIYPSDHFGIVANLELRAD